MFNYNSISLLVLTLLANSVHGSFAATLSDSPPLTKRLVSETGILYGAVSASETGRLNGALGRQSGVTIRLTVPTELRKIASTMRIAGTYNNWAPPQPMKSVGNGVFEFSINVPSLNEKTVQYRLYIGSGTGWDGAEGPGSFKREFVYGLDKAINLDHIIFGANDVAGSGAKPPEIDINIDSAQRFQEMDGFGAALTDASAWLIAKKLSAAQRASLLTSLFDPAMGAGLSYIRLPIDASDFSLTEHTYDDLPTGETDYPMAHFSVAYDEAYIIPVAKQILAVNPHLKFMASPWSAPAWMKESGKLDGGRLKNDDATYAAYANYLARFVQTYVSQGIPIDMMTLQNEPRNQPDGYPSMGMEPADEARLAKLLGARFKATNIGTKIVVWDHNWDHPEYPIQVLLDPAARSYIDGAAFHGYAGDVAAQSKFHDAFPDKSIYFTESTGGNFAPEFSGNLMWDTTNLIVGSTRNWAKTVLKWNLALDEKNRPHVPGGPDNCRGIVTIDEKTGTVTREEEYYSFAHAAKFVQPGAHRIYSDDPSSVAFANPDGSVALIFFNASYRTQSYRVRVGGRTLSEGVPPRSVVTLAWSATIRGAVQVWMTTGDQTKLLERQSDLNFSVQ